MSTQEPTSLGKFTLDTDAMLRVENLMLKKQRETLMKKIEEMRSSRADEDLSMAEANLFAWLAEKYGVDLTTHKINLNPASGTIEIIEL